MEITTELMNKVKNAETPEEIMQIAKENEADITLENAKMILTALKQQKEQKAPEKKPKRSTIKKQKSDS